MRIAAPLILVSALIALTVIALKRPDPATTAPAQESAGLPVYQRVCLECHGAQGEGNDTLKTPSIAGQPAWYLTEQLHKFRRGHRGTEPRDVFGQQMRAVALTLSEAELDEVTLTVASFPRLPSKATFKADSVHGRQIYEEQCMECHRYNGSGEKVFGSSPLANFQDWYVAAQIEKFRQAIRGYHPADEKGLQMRHLISYLSETDALDVSAYIATLTQRYPPKMRMGKAKNK